MYLLPKAIPEAFSIKNQSEKREAEREKLITRLILSSSLFSLVERALQLCWYFGASLMRTVAADKKYINGGYEKSGGERLVTSECRQSAMFMMVISWFPFASLSL